MTESDQNKNPESDPHIVVDDDWKSQVENEKKKLQEQMDAEPVSGSEQMPEASFQMLVTTLATQSMVSLGIIPDPISNQPQVNRPVAKHLIDTLSMLEEKTKGNLGKDEESFLSDTLHQLRMTYVAVPAQTEPETKKSSIELP